MTPSRPKLAADPAVLAIARALGAADARRDWEREQARRRQDGGDNVESSDAENRDLRPVLDRSPA